MGEMPEWFIMPLFSLAQALLFLAMWGICYGVVLIVAIVFAMCSRWYGETPNIFYAFCGIIALLLNILIFLAGWVRVA